MLDSFFELRDFAFEHLITLCIRHTISKEHEVGGRLAHMLLRELLNRVDNNLGQIGLHDLLALMLNYVLRVVLTELGVDRGAQTYNRLITSVANVQA